MSWLRVFHGIFTWDSRYNHPKDTIWRRLLNSTVIIIAWPCTSRSTVFSKKRVNSGFFSTFEKFTDFISVFLVPEAPPGVYLYLGYSRIDAEILKQGRMKLDDEVQNNKQLFHRFFLIINNTHCSRKKIENIIVIIPFFWRNQPKTM